MIALLEYLQLIHQGLLLNAICLLVLYFYSLSLSLCSLTLFLSRLFILKLKNLSNNYVHVFVLLPLLLFPLAILLPILLLLPLLLFLLLLLYRMSRNKQSIDVSSLPKIATALLEPGEWFSPSPPPPPPLPLPLYF